MSGRKGPLAVRFERQTCPEPNSGCLLWLGALDAHGYGRITTGDGHKYLAHRAAWELSGREIPAGTYVLHNCDNPLCVSVRHLRIGSAADNQRDMQARHRGIKSKRGLPRGVKLVASGRFAAAAHAGGKVIHAGTFDTAEEAAAMAEQALRNALNTPEMEPRS